MSVETIRVIDTHTAGEPTRVVVDGFPDLGAGSLAECRAKFADKFDRYRSAIVNEPRGSDVMVGALLCPPRDPECVTGVIFFNNVGYLNMCGHGTIGVIAALAHLGRVSPGEVSIETPVGKVTCDYLGEGRVRFENVPAYRYRTGVDVAVADYGIVTGEIAWGGNWFFLVNAPEPLWESQNIEALTAFAWSVRRALEQAGITGADQGEIDHIEIFGPAGSEDADSRNFVLCPGGAYDRSPCGTGTSAKIACLAEEGKLQEGEVWRQESIIGSRFEGTYRRTELGVIPQIAGAAYITAEATLRLDPADPFCWGIPASEMPRPLPPTAV